MLQVTDSFGLNDSAWNNKGSTTFGLFCWFSRHSAATRFRYLARVAAYLRVRYLPWMGPVSIGINRGSWGDPYFVVRGEILRPTKDEHQRRQFTNLLSLIKNESKGIEDDQIPS